MRRVCNDEYLSDLKPVQGRVDRDRVTWMKLKVRSWAEAKRNLILIRKGIESSRVLTTNACCADILTRA